MTRRIGIGLAGAGRMGSIHARLLAGSIPEARLVALVDTNADAARRLSSEVGAPVAGATVAELAAAPEVEAVLVAVPSNQHLAAVEVVAAAGKHLLCEKPLALTLEDTDRAIRAAASAGVELQVGFMRRWDPDYRRAKARLASGAFGRPILFKSLQFDPQPPPLTFADPRVSGGIMGDMGVHEFDLARWLVGDEVVEVHAYAGTVAHPDLATVGDVDSAVVNLRFAGGAIGCVDLARSATYGEDVRTEVLATRGSVWVGLLPLTAGASSRADGVTIDSLDARVPRFLRAYAEQMGGFARALLEGRTVEVTGTDGRAALAIALAAQRSLREGRPVAVEPRR